MSCNAYLLRLRRHGKESCDGIASRSTTGIGVVRTDRVKIRFPRKPNIVFRWGCTISVPPGINVINTGKAIGLASDKTAFRSLLRKKDLCPPTFLYGEDLPEGRFVGRPSHHEQGERLYVYENRAAARNAWDRIGRDGYLSTFIPKVAEYRVFVVSGRAICVARKTPDNPDAVAWNHADGAHFENVRFNDWPLKAIKASIEAFNLSGLDFGAVDVMVGPGKERKPYVLEINTAPALESEYRQTCFARAFDYIVRHGNKKIPLVEAKGGYLKFVHPAIDGKAMV